MTDEERYVRERWPGTANAVAEGFDMYGIDLVRGGPGVYRLPTPEAAWQAAAEFTRERLEAIRLVEEEIDVLTEYKDLIVPEAGVVLTRVLVSRQAALKELKQGMKE